LSFIRDLRVAAHSLIRPPGLAITVTLTLALGIGANGAIFTLVRGVLLKPLVNRDENRLVYIRQSAPSGGQDNTTFSVPEIKDSDGSVPSVCEFGACSTMDFTMVGLGEPRGVQGGVVSGNYFEVMGLRPVLGRLIGPQDDGPNAAGVIVFTCRFWSSFYKKDPNVIGKTVRVSSIGDRSAAVVGVLEPSVPYPADTEIVGNLVISPHHLSATMVTGRIHRMTELFGKLAPGATLDQARNELRTVYAGMQQDHPDAYPDNGGYRIDAKMLRDQITSGARTVLLVLLAASGLVFIIACSNVANLILARAVRREGELAVRVALGASKGSLRRMLLAESLLLCGAGAALGVLSAQPMVAVLAIDVPAMSFGKTSQQVVDFYKESMRRIDALPGVSETAFGNVVPWRDTGYGFQFSGDGHAHAANVEDPRAQWRSISPGFFAALGVPMIAGRDFNALDNQNSNAEPVVIVSQTLAQRMFPKQDAVNRHVYWTDPVLQFASGSEAEKARMMAPRRIIGVTADIDDGHVVPEPTVTVYSPFDEGPIFGGRLFIHTSANPYALVPSVTRVIREMSADQPVEHAATLADVRAEVLTPDRLNSLVFGVFAAVALAIAVVGVAGVLAFSVSARTREFGIRLALGSRPQNLLRGVLAEGAAMAAAGVFAGGAFGFALARVAGRYFLEVKMPGALPVFVSAFVLMTVAVVASVLPAARAARVDVMQALRSE